MCKMDKVVSYELAFLPIQSEDYIKDVDKVLKIISDSGLKHTVGTLSTTVSGNSGELFKLAEEIYNHMNNQCKFKFDIRISNICRYS
jgi:uncharacterized protein YqgV (UPF0045/DUF77 family)